MKYLLLCAKDAVVWRVEGTRALTFARRFCYAYTALTGFFIVVGLLA